MSKAERTAPKPRFVDAWADFARGGEAGRLLAVIAVGTLAFSMQDVLLEPYGGEILGLSVAATTLLTALWAGGALGGFALAARRLTRGADPYRLAAHGVGIGIVAFCAVIFAEPIRLELGSRLLLFAGAGLIGFGAGLFAVATLTAAMTMPVRGEAGRGLALGAWGAAQATAAGLGVLVAGGMRDLVGQAAESGALGPALASPVTGYSFVYHTEIGLLFLTLVLVGPMVRLRRRDPRGTQDAGGKFGLAEFPT